MSLCRFNHHSPFPFSYICFYTFPFTYPAKLRNQSSYFLQIHHTKPNLLHTIRKVPCKSLYFPSIQPLSPATPTFYYLIFFVFYFFIHIQYSCLIPLLILFRSLSVPFAQTSLLTHKRLIQFRSLPPTPYFITTKFSY